jgi:hypothetical protein
MTGLTTREFTGRPKRPRWLTATYLVVPTVVLVTAAGLVPMALTLGRLR